MRGKNIIVGIHQPCYWPWLGLIQKMLVSDIFILLDDVQFNKRAFQHRTYIKIPNKKKYLTLSVHAKKHQIRNLLIKDVLIKSRKRIDEHWDLIKQFYHNSPNWTQYYSEIKNVYEQDYENLIEINMETIKSTIKIFDIKSTDFRFSNEFANKGSKEDLIINLCKAVGGDIYFSGQGAKDYQNKENFEKSGITLVYQAFEHPTYEQIWEGFEPGCAGFDLPLNDRNVFEAFRETSLTLKEKLRNDAAVFGDE